MALLGTAAALLGLGLANNIYVQIGLVLLIALSAKNAILIVEMAREGREKGRSIEEATVDASRVRFRPILMTSFTFILGVLPLVLASGAGAAARRSLGIAVATGMLASTVPRRPLRALALRRPAALDRAEEAGSADSPSPRRGEGRVRGLARMAEAPRLRRRSAPHPNPLPRGEGEDAVP